MQSFAGRLMRSLILAASLAFILAHAAPTPDMRIESSDSPEHYRRSNERDIVTPEPEDYAYESELLNADPEFLDETTTDLTFSEKTSTYSHTADEQEDKIQNEPVRDVKGSDTEITAWMRPDRISFDGEQAPFVIPDGDDVTWYKIGEEQGGATTIAAQQVKEITDYQGQVVTATIGDVMIFQDGAVAEAIGSVLPDGVRGEMYNIIACNVQSESGKCIMVDYDGREVRETLSKVIKGKTATIALGAPTAVPAALSEWAANVMVLNVATVTAKPEPRRSRGRRL